MSRLDELQAAVLRVKLRHIDTWIAQRRNIASLYISGLSTCSHITLLPHELGSCFHLFVIRSKQRDALQNYLKQSGIGTAIHYPVPLHLTRVCKEYGYRHGDFPVAERLSSEILSLPLYPELTKVEIALVIRAIKKFV